jgi:hypothetical protein
MKLSKALYFGDFVAIPVVILWLGVAAVQQEGFTGAGLWMIAFLAGVAVWTFVEYAVHRWIYHAVPFFEKFHDAHHEDPKALIGVPSFISSGIILAVFFVPLWLTIGIVLAGGFTSGSLLGYAGYMLVHHALSRPRPAHGPPLSQHAWQLRRRDLVLGSCFLHQRRPPTPGRRNLSSGNFETNSREATTLHRNVMVGLWQFCYRCAAAL